MALSSSGIASGQVVKSTHVLQYFNLLTGVMTDQVTTLGDGLVLAANSGAGTLTFLESSGKVIMGSTQLSFRNAANNADNLIILNSGVLQLRGIASPNPTTAGQVSYDTATNTLVYGNGTTTVSLTGGSISTPVSVANGGTGSSTLTAHDLVVGNGTSAVTLVAPGTSGYPLLSQGASADPTYAQLTASGIANGTITSTQIASGTITASQISSGTVTSTQLANPLFGNNYGNPSFTDNSGGVVNALASTISATTKGRNVVVFLSLAVTVSTDSYVTIWIKEDAGSYNAVATMFLRSGSTSQATITGFWGFAPSAASHTWTGGYSASGTVSAVGTPGWAVFEQP